MTTLEGQRRFAWAIVLFALAKLLFHIVTNTQYGFHRDELATLDDARHLAWGYVAYPPLTPFLGRIELLLFGPSLTGFRSLAAAAQSLAIVIAAAIAHRLGGGAAAQWITAIAVAIAPISLAASALFQYVSFDDLWWVLLAYLVVRLVETKDPRWWMAIGLVIGLGALTKYTIVFFVAGIVAGVLASPLRRHLGSGWLWAGVAISLLVAMPNMLWQVRHDFITLDFLRSIHERDMRIGRTAGFLLDQLLVTSNIIVAPLWAAGLVALMISTRLERFRILAVMAVVPFLLFLLARGRGYYMGPVYPMLLAAGAVELTHAVDRWSAPAKRAAYALIAIVLLAGSSAALVVLPVAPIGSSLFRFASAHNGDLKEEIGWPELVGEVTRIWRSIPPAERARTAIYCANYGEAGGVNLYGAENGLPNAISGVNSFWARGYGNPPPETVIVLGSTRERLERRYAEVTLAGRIPNPYQVPNEESECPEIFICRGIRIPWPKLWPQIRGFG